MTDLITDLREWAHGRSLYTAPVLARKAADRIAALEAALRPFSIAADDLDERHGDHADIWEAPAAMNITAGHLRQAAALSPSGGEAA